MAKSERRQRKKKSDRRKTYHVDFSGVKAGGRRRIPEADYVFKVKDFEEGEGEKGEYISWECHVSKGKHKGFKAWLITSMAKKALWKLRQFMEALGVEKVKGKYDLQPQKFIGLEFSATVEDDTYKGKTRSKITEVFPLDELEEDDEDSDDDDEETEETEDEEEIEESDDDEESEDKDEEDEEVEEETEDEDEEEEKSKKKGKGKKGK